MLDQQCKACGLDYDYYDRTATVVCPKNHVLCRNCAAELRTYAMRCPQCEASPNPYGIRESMEAQRKEHRNPNQGPRPGPPPAYGGQGYGPAQSSGQAQGFNAGGFQPQAYPQQYPVVQPNYAVPARVVNEPFVINSSSPGFNRFLRNQKALCLTFVLCAIVFGICLDQRIKMNSCNYWGYYSCYYSDISWQMCCNDYCHTQWYTCDSIFIVQSISLVIFTTMLCSLSAFLGLASVIFCIRAGKLAKLERARLLYSDAPNQNYVRA